MVKITPGYLVPMNGLPVRMRLINFSRSKEHPNNAEKIYVVEW